MQTMKPLHGINCKTAHPPPPPRKTRTTEPHLFYAACVGVCLARDEKKTQSYRIVPWDTRRPRLHRMPQKRLGTHPADKTQAKNKKPTHTHTQKHLVVELAGLLSRLGLVEPERLHPQEAPTPALLVLHRQQHGVGHAHHTGIQREGCLACDAVYRNGETGVYLGVGCVNSSPVYVEATSEGPTYKRRHVLSRRRLRTRGLPARPHPCTRYIIAQANHPFRHNCTAVYMESGHLHPRLESVQKLVQYKPQNQTKPFPTEPRRAEASLSK